jgi:MFS family permease
VDTTAHISKKRLDSKTALLVVVCLAQFMVILDVSIVNVALPEIHDGLRFSTPGLQWVVNAYTLTFAGFLMLGGRAADLLGRRRVFIAGTALFALSSLACSLADSRGLLIGARALQGFGGAVLSPATLSIITSSLREGPERNRGLAMWGAMGALGASSGALFGGILTQAFGWSAIFAINVPLGVLVIVLGLRLIPAPAAANFGAATEDLGVGAKDDLGARARDDLAARATDDPAAEARHVVGERPPNVAGERPPRHFDATGAVLVTASLVSLTFGIVRTDTLGWGSTGVLAPLAGGVVLLAAFMLVEARIARVPLVPLAIFRVGQLRAANLVVILLYAAFFPVWFFLTLYLQQVLHYDAIEAGVSFLPMTLSIFAASTLAPRLVARLGPRRVIAGGMLCATFGMALLTGVAPGGTYVGSMLPGAVLASVGMGLSLVPATIVAMQGLERSQSGLGSGLLNTSRLVGGALGLAVLSTIADAKTHGELTVGAARALTDGFDLAFAVGALLCLAGAAVAALLLAPRATAGVAPLPAQTTEIEEREALAA